jgi:hypothetical protein
MGAGRRLHTRQASQCRRPAHSPGRRIDMIVRRNGEAHRRTAARAPSPHTHPKGRTKAVCRGRPRRSLVGGNCLASARPKPCGNLAAESGSRLGGWRLPKRGGSRSRGECSTRLAVSNLAVINPNSHSSCLPDVWPCDQREPRSTTQPTGVLDSFEDDLGDRLSWRHDRIGRPASADRTTRR